MSKINRREWIQKASRAKDLADFHGSRAEHLTEVLQNTRPKKRILAQRRKKRSLLDRILGR